VEHLRLIFAEFHAIGMKDAVTFPRVFDNLDADGNFAPNLERCNSTAKLMLDQLAWWAITLRDAKAQRPYRT
jgi:hypothetical protein